MAAASYVQDISICHGTCALQDYFDLLIYDLDIMTIKLKMLSAPLLGK